MGTSNSFGELAKKLEASAKAIETKSDVEVTEANAKAAKKAIAGQMKRAAPGGTLRVGKTRKARVGVRYDFRQDKKAAIVRVTGPVHLLERDTSAHNIPRVKGDIKSHSATGRKLKKATKVRKVQERKLLRIGNRVVVGPIKHPGTKGKHPFEKGVKDFLPSAGKTFEKGVDTIMRGIF